MAKGSKGTKGGKGKKGKVLGPSTVVKPAMIGAIVLYVLNAVLTFVLGGGA
ncbi:MAG: hypothetical protein ACT4OX_04115 [Actinomycetota bacterium]